VTADQVRAEWSGSGGRIVGLICHVIDETANRWMVVQQTNVYGFAKPGSLDEILRGSLGEGAAWPTRLGTLNAGSREYVDTAAALAARYRRVYGGG